MVRRSIPDGTAVSALPPQSVVVPLHAQAAGQLVHTSGVDELPPTHEPWGSREQLELQPSPEKALASSQASVPVRRPSPHFWHVSADVALPPLQLYPLSTAHPAPHPSPAAEPPSSQPSAPTRLPSPHTEKQRDETDTAP